ncbi:hypothetical protein EPUL_000060 [Erysiphe pulchra]|uniref:DHHA2 domain-containing protein n=1 Tax=Erysiphe pulchra TaxID=225359 RepID=A0A2S4Q276_9PEZI|nr:hypothetical protein EPUL_000060 [Erysiphe pulchra]
MNSNRLPLGTFLSNAKKALRSYKTNSSELLTFIIGNESADLDSICSTIVFAYISTHLPKISKKTSDDTSSTLYIPLANLRRSSLHQRPELKAALQYAHLSPSELITLSDLPEPLPPPEKTRWVLVDHNVPTGELGKLYGKCVVGCIDHHEDESKLIFGNKNGNQQEEEPRIIEQVCSCASLVTAWAQERWLPKLQPSMAEDSGQTNSQTNGEENWDQENARLAYLALAPILIDSACLQSVRTKQKDIFAATFLEELILRHDRAAYDRSIFFNKISTAKQDLSPFTLTEILEKDYKQWTESEPVQDPKLLPFNFGIIAVVQPITFLLEKANGISFFLQTLLHFAHKRKLSLLAVMTTSSRDGKFQRELFVWSLDDRGVKAGKIFEKTACPKLSLSKWSQGDFTLDWDSESQELEATDKNFCIGWRRCWTQHEVNSSRKQVYPLLRSAVEWNSSLIS